MISEAEAVDLLIDENNVIWSKEPEYEAIKEVAGSDESDTEFEYAVAYARHEVAYQFKKEMVRMKYGRLMRPIREAS